MSEKKLHIRNSTTELLIFTRQTGENGIEVRVENGTVWLTQKLIGVLRNFALRGYVLDKERLKNGAFLSKEYFDDLLAEIREIRASERMFY